MEDYWNKMDIITLIGLIILIGVPTLSLLIGIISGELNV